MPTDAEITFADHAGRFYARRYGMAPMVGRLLGYLAICDPREQSIALLAEAPPKRRAVLLEWAAFADFLVARLPELEKDWKAHRESLRAAGELPDSLSHY